MGKKKNKGNTPRRKRWGRTVRLENAKGWITEYKGKRMIHSYAKWYGVDKRCALHELEMLGMVFSQKEKDSVEESIRAKEQRKMKKKQKEIIDDEEDFIMGYTSWGFPYGLTDEEIEEIKNEKMDIDEKEWPF